MGQKRRWDGGATLGATASIERTFFLRGNVSATLRVEDACTSCGDTSRHPYYSNPQAKYYSPGPADPAINVLNFLADMKWPHFDAEIFVSNALDAHPVLARGTYGYLGDQPETITPRTLSISGSWRF